MKLLQNTSSARRHSPAFTLLELMTAMIIIAILFAMFIPVLGHIRKKVEKANCANNLRNLHTAMAGHLQDHKRWPQIPVEASRLEDSARAWVETLEPYGISHENWICPSAQRLTKDADYTKLENFRIDYRPSYYDPHPTSPTRWATQPWFIETGNNHGGGNLLIYMDGTIEELYHVRRDTY